MSTDGDWPSLERRAAVHAALGDPYRLAIVEELALSDRSPLELRRLLGLESNLLAHHLEVLERAGLLERSTSYGDRRRKYVHLRPEHLRESGPHAALTAGAVLFVCTANSARSQLAAALWNARSDVPAASAGTQPAEQVHPEAVRAAGRVGLDLRGARPRALEDVEVAADLVVTVCDRAHEQSAPPGAQVLHWSVPDPAADGTAAAFDTALSRLEARVDALVPLVALPN